MGADTRGSDPPDQGGRPSGAGMAEYIRRPVDRDLQQRGAGAGVSAIFGIGNSSGSDIADDRKGATAEVIATRAARRR